ncbi:MAG TPA: acyl-CoA dehydrogenase, partial [Bacteroidetes bacterium]|nr:acyl-CoA dehydrogenase [Bacteroidota bacterium]
MSFDLTEDQIMIRDTARDFAERFIAPGVIERDMKAEFPHALVGELAEMGLMGIIHPEQ